MASSSTTKTAPERARPLSPHLQVYRLPLVAITSITHRITGVGNAIGLILMTYWLIAAAGGEVAYDNAMWFFGSFIGRLMLFCWTLSIFYHLLNGIRHLVWDAGYGYSLPVANKSATFVCIATIVLTIITWIIGYAVYG